MQRVRGSTTAPYCAAERAFSTTSRASSTQQSKYAKPFANCGFSPAP